jgi:hypothetical protein
MRTCFVHIGAPKAGSTSIQRFLQNNKEALVDLGVVSPGLKARQNFLVSMFHASPLQLPFNHGFKDDEAAFRADLAEQKRAFDDDLAQHPNSNFVISNEQFLLQSSDLDLAGLFDFLKRYTSEIRIVICVRDPVQAAISRAQEMVKVGRNTFDEVSRKAPIVPLEAASRYIDVFGKERMIAIKMDSGTSILDPFAAVVGISPEQLKKLDTRRVNESISLEAALIASHAPTTRETKSGKRRSVRPAHLRQIGETRFSLPASAFKGRWWEFEKQYKYAADVLGVGFQAPVLANWPEPKPNWNESTLAGIATALSELAGRNDKMRRRNREKKARRSEEGDDDQSRRTRRRRRRAEASAEDLPAEK